MSIKSGTGKLGKRPNPARWMSGSLSDLAKAGADNKTISGGHVAMIDFEIAYMGACVEYYDPGLASLLDKILT